jgi:hypothetical protein
MHARIAFAMLAAAFALATTAFAQAPDTTSAPGALDPRQFPTGAPPAGSSITNPAISVIGWVQAVAGNDTLAQEQAIELREAELALQAAVDPYTRADFFIGVGEHGVELEEGTITWLALPGGGQAKVGKFLADLGKFNRTHAAETPFADRPLAAEAFLGDHGLATTGVAASVLLPAPVYWDVTANVGTIPEGHEDDEHGGEAEDGEDHAGEAGAVFEADSRSDLFALGRTSVFLPMGGDADLNLGVSYANALANADARETQGNRAQLATGDVTFRWKDSRRNDRSLLLQAELTALQGDGEAAERYHGWFGYGIWQLTRRIKVGARWDWTQLPGVHEHERGALALIQFKPSEFSTMSVQARRIWEPGDTERDAVFFKWVFNIGPHGAHPY